MIPVVRFGSNQATQGVELMNQVIKGIKDISEIGKNINEIVSVWSKRNKAEARVENHSPPSIPQQQYIWLSWAWDGHRWRVVRWDGYKWIWI